MFESDEQDFSNKNMIQPIIEQQCNDVQVVDSKSPSNDCPWCNGKEYHHSSSTLRLHREIIDFVKWISPTPEERHLRDIVILRFRNALKLLWPESKLILHGSSANQTYLPNGDIDFVVYGPPKNCTDEKLLEDLNLHLNSLNLFRGSEIIRSARCPIIKGVEKPFGYHIDIAVNNYNGILNIKRNRKLMEVYPALYPLFMFLKFFMFQIRLDEPYHGGISSNTLQQMIVFVIQSSSDRDQLSLGRLLQLFFKTFGDTFNYITTGFSTREGGRLFSKLDLGRVDWKYPIALCIEDPQNPGAFLGENCFRCYEFRKYCYSSFSKLMRESTSYQQSILLRIIERPNWLINYRSDLLKQYQTLVGNPTESIPLIQPKEEHNRQRQRYNDRPSSTSRNDFHKNIDFRNNNSDFRNNYRNNNRTYPRKTERWETTKSFKQRFYDKK